MAPSPYPIDALPRTTDILVCDGISASYGPFDFKIFDVSDVEVFIELDGEFGHEPTSVTVTKTLSLTYDTCSITFPDIHPDGTRFVVVGARQATRSTAITRGSGSLDSGALEVEISKISISLQEFSNKFSRTIQQPHASADIKFGDRSAGGILQWDEDTETIITKANVTDIEAAKEHSDTALEASEAATKALEDLGVAVIAAQEAAQNTLSEMVVVAEAAANSADKAEELADSVDNDALLLAIAGKADQTDLTALQEALDAMPVYTYGTDPAPDPATGKNGDIYIQHEA